MKFTKCLLAVLALSTAAGTLSAQDRPVLRSGVDPITLIMDGRPFPGGWRIMPELDPDELTTTARETVFASDVDTMRIVLDEWQSKDFDILTAEGDTAHVRVSRTATNPFENPSPRIKSVSPSGLLSREQAAFDIQALVYALSQVHPDLFSVCSQEDFFLAINTATATLPDSVSPMELYRRAAPIVAMIGDGHTHLWFPYNSVFTADLKRMPLYVEVLTDRTLICKTCLDSLVPQGARILGINGRSADRMIDAMLPFVSGERPHFRLSRINSDFTALHQMLFSADSYEVSFITQDAKKPRTVTLPAVLWNEIEKRCPPSSTSRNVADYSLHTNSTANFAVMDFRSFQNPERMEIFADSMFRTLHQQGIGNLIIDLRNNGGGNSYVGDILLRYISPEPFTQMDKILMRITPLTAKLMGGGQTPKFIFHEVPSEEYKQPRTAEEGHYRGRVYLLTSNKTFSSAGSFAWTFKECGIGPVIGEETGGMNVCYGDVLNYRLPVSDLWCSLSYKRFWKFRADENDIHGTIPDVAVPAAEAMDAAMKLIRKNNGKRK